jgi:putative ABC transport system permease protein
VRAELFADFLEMTDHLSQQRYKHPAAAGGVRTMSTQGIRSALDDAHHAVRGLRRAPLFFAGTVFTLALGIGANGAVFSILQAVLLQPLPYDHPKELVMVWRAPAMPTPGPPGMVQARAWRGLMTGDMVSGVRHESHDTLSNLAALVSWQGNLESQFDLTLADGAERLRGAFVTPNFFDVLGVQAAAGRAFSATTADPSALVISDALWHRAFGGDSSILGRPLTLVTGRSPRGPRTFTVIGVLPAAFRFTYPEETEAWAIIPWANVEDYGSALGPSAVARLRPGVTLPVAQAQVRSIQTGLRSRPNIPAQDREIYRLEPIADWVVADTRPSLLLLGGIACLLLLITCATVANALFVRVTERQRELAVRASLGADRRRLARQLLTEGLVLAVAGAAVGTALAAVIAPVLRALVPAIVPRGDAIGVSPWILAFAAGAAGLTTILSALAPAWRGAHVDLVSTLKRAAGAVSADRATARWRQSLVGAQVAVATALLVAATLLLVSFWRLGHVPLGFDGTQVLTVEMRLLDRKYQSKGGPPGDLIRSVALPAFQRDLLTNVRALPGVLEASLTSAVPFRGTDFMYVLSRVGAQKVVFGNGRFVDPAYFALMRIPTIRGRVFSDRDTPTSPKVVVISQSYARKMFGAEDPIGQTIDRTGPRTVVGVVGDVRSVGLDTEPGPAIYFPSAQEPSELICLVVRTASQAGDLGPAIRHVIRDLDPSLPAMRLTTIDQIISDSVADRRFYTTATGAFAAVALVLTVVGVLVVVARSVVERRRELAIRAALGATTSGLMQLVMGRGLVPVLVGTGVGATAAAGGATLLRRFLFQVTPYEPLAYAGVTLLMVGMAALASLLPARQVAGMAPADVLRAD